MNMNFECWVVQALVGQLIGEWIDSGSTPPESPHHSQSQSILASALPLVFFPSALVNGSWPCFSSEDALSQLSYCYVCSVGCYFFVWFRCAWSGVHTWDLGTYCDLYFSDSLVSFSSLTRPQWFLFLSAYLLVNTIICALPPFFLSCNPL